LAVKIIIETREGDIENPFLEVQMQSGITTLRIYPTREAAQEESQRRVDTCTRTKEAGIEAMIRTLEHRLSALKEFRDGIRNGEQKSIASVL
jgi:BMFP domain-containing protein YqiC